VTSVLPRVPSDMTRT